MDLSTIIKIKAGKLQPYKRAQLFASLIKACDHRKDTAESAFYILEICENAILNLENKQNLNSKTVAEITAGILRRFDTLAWAKYCSYHNLPFEKGLKQ